MHMKAPAYEVYIVFSFSSISAPTLGIIIGGILTDRIGGYQKKYFNILCLKLGIMALAFSLPIPFLTDRYIFYALMWFLLFFG